MLKKCAFSKYTENHLRQLGEGGGRVEGVWQAGGEWGEVEYIDGVLVLNPTSFKGFSDLSSGFQRPLLL